jgi:hypothetical protein
MNRLRLSPLLLGIALGCNADSPRDIQEPHPHREPSPEHPIVCNLDLSNPLPLVSLSATPEEAARLRARYASFAVEMGRPEKGGIPTLRFDRKGSLGNPWNFYLRNYSAPYPVRLVGFLPDGTKEVLHEETYP